MSAWEAKVARAAEGLDHLNTLSPPLEVRRIVIAQGKQFRNEDPDMYWTAPEFLSLTGKERYASMEEVIERKHGTKIKAALYWPAMGRMEAIPLTAEDDGSFTHVSLQQGVLFSIRVVDAKDDFVSGLQEPDLHLIYQGHARYGRGPCFGSGGRSRGEEWENGHGPAPNSDGIFRMGHPYLSAHGHEPVEHGYTANLVRSDIKLAPADCDPDLRRNLGRLRARTLAEIDRSIANHVRDKLKLDEQLAGHVSDADMDATYWTFGSGADLEVVMHAGWSPTVSAPDDLGSIDPLCRVFCHFGCSSYMHNYPVVRKMKGWKRSGNDRYAYWTTAASHGPTEIYWLQNILTYPKYNAWESWASSLEYAVRKTNAALGTDRTGFRII